MANPQQMDGRDGLGVLGGMGPLASAEFLDTLYRFWQGRLEQEAPVVLLYSDPRVADRTSTFLADDREAERRMLAELEANLRRLCQPGITQLVICCITIHHLFDRLPADLRHRTRSLVEVALEAVARRRKPHLMVCTRGTYRLQIFQRHPLWEGVAEWIRFPDDGDQERIHRAIYQLKKNHETSGLVTLLRDLAERYGVGSLIAGCTEVHLAARHFPLSASPSPGTDAAAADIELLDPLTIIAQQWMERT